MGRVNCLMRERNESGEKNRYMQSRDIILAGEITTVMQHGRTETHVHEGTKLKWRTVRYHDLTPEGRSASCRAYLRGDPMREVGGVGLLPALCRRRTACRRNVLRSRRKMTVSSLPGAVTMRHINGRSDFPFFFLGLTLQDTFHVNQSGRCQPHTTGQEQQH